MWRSLVSRLNGVQEAAGSNPVTRTMIAEHYRWNGEKASHFNVFGNFLFSKFFGNSIDEIVVGRGSNRIWTSVFPYSSGFSVAAPFFRGLRRRDSGRNEEKSFTKLWALDCWFSRTKSSAFFALKKGTEIGGMIVCFGLCPCQHNGTYTRNVYLAIPTKEPT